MVGASTDIVNTGTLPALTFGPYECDTWPITNITMGQSGFMQKLVITNMAYRRAQTNTTLRVGISRIGPKSPSPQALML